MRRRVLLFAITLAAVGVALWVYYAASRDPSYWRDEFQIPGEVGPNGDKVRVVEGAEAFSGDKPEYEHWVDHRLRARFRGESWKPLGDDRYLLIKPHLEWFLTTGETLTLDAEEGMVRVRLIGKTPDVLGGDLSGDVRIVLDSSRDPGRGSLEDRPGDAVRIHIEQASFDRDALTIRSDGHVSVFSAAADILGRGLRLSWSEQPRRPRLRELRILHGEYMCIRRQQDRFIKGWTLPGVPGGGKAGPADSSTGAMSPAPARWMGPQLAAAAMAQASDPAATRTRPAGPAPILKDTYEATFSDDVLVTHGGQRLEGVDRLHLIFEVKVDDRSSRTKPASSPASRSARLPVSPAALLSALPPASPSRAAATGPASQPIGEQDKSEPLEVTWTGPLTIRPYRSWERRADGRLDITARGRQLRLLDAETGTEARCRELKYVSEGRLARLMGTDAEPVRLTMADGVKVRAPRVRFDGGNNRIYMDGAGTMEGLANAGPDVAGTSRDTKGEMNVAWSRDVEVLLGEQEVVADGKRTTEPYLRQADFHGDVDIKQAPDLAVRAEELTVRFHPPAPGSGRGQPASLDAAGGVKLDDRKRGDTISARKLHVELGSTAEGKPYPRSATATGNVTARQDQADIAAEKFLTVTFAAPTVDSNGKLDVRPRRLDAAGNVKVTFATDEGPVTASADSLVTELTDDPSAKAPVTSAVLTGHARVARTDSVIEGERIVLEQPREAATVTGKGKLSFLATTDITGAKADKPTPVTVTWHKGLEYRGQKRSALFSGNVQMTAGRDSLDCRQLRVLFAPPDEKEEAEAATRPAPKQPMYEPRKIAMILADKGVKLESLTMDDEGYWTRRLSMSSPDGQVVYEAADERVTCFGPGLLTVEDYRPPDPTKPKRAADPISAGPDRPSQTVFTWRESMQLSRKDRTASFVGEVAMSQCTGKDLVLKGKLKVRPWGELKEGRTMTMSCDRMFAEFGAPDSRSASTGSSDPISGEGVGPLELFRARAAKGRRYVKIHYGAYRIVCRRIVFKRSDDLAILYGHLENEPPANAEIVNEDNFTRITNSRILWRPKANRFEAQGVRVKAPR